MNLFKPRLVPKALTSPPLAGEIRQVLQLENHTFVIYQGQNILAVFNKHHHTQPHPATILSICAYQSKYCVTGDMAGNLQVWDAKTLQRVAHTRIWGAEPGQFQSILKLAEFQDAIVSVHDAGIDLWRVNQGELVKVSSYRPTHGDFYPTCIAASATQIAVGQSTGEILIWNPATQQHFVISHQNTADSLTRTRPKALCFLDENTLASAGSNGLVMVTDLATKAIKARNIFICDTDITHLIAIDGERFALGNQAGQFTVLTATDPKLCATWVAKSEAASPVAGLFYQASELSVMYADGSVDTHALKSQRSLSSSLK